MLSTQNFFNQNNFDERFPCINQELSIVNAKICRLRCVMFISVFIRNIKESSSNETESQESYFFNQDTLASLKEIQRQIINFDKSLKIMVHCRDANLGSMFNLFNFADL